MKWIVQSKSLETVAFKSLLDFQRYVAEYSRAFDNVSEYMFTQNLKFIPLVYTGFDKRSTLSRRQHDLPKVITLKKEV